MYGFQIILPILLKNSRAFLWHLVINLYKIHGFRNPSPKFHGFQGTHGTHANAATEILIRLRLY